MKDTLYFGFIVVMVVLAIGRLIGGIIRQWKLPDIQTNETKINRSLQCVPTTKIRAARRGEVVKIAGKIRAVDRTLRAPLSKRRCVLYEVLVEQYIAESNSGADWRIILHEVVATDFMIEDDTDQALIKQDKLEAELRATSDKDCKKESGTMNDAPQDLENYLEEHGHSSKGWILNKTIRYWEGVFELGETVVAMGTATWEHAPSTPKAGDGYRGAGQQFVLGPLPGGSVLLSDNAKVVRESTSTGTTDT